MTPREPRAWSADPVATQEVVQPSHVAALAALFDDGLPPPMPGDELPTLWHWVALPQWSPASDTGTDGHPATGSLLPDLGKPRRMFAGGEVRFHASLLVGEEIRREDRVVDVVPKSGRQGEFVLVQLQTRIFRADGQLAIDERRDLVYRDAALPAESPVTTRPEPLVQALLRLTDDAWTFQTDPTKLMRFSALTSNGHRIHYDHPYATQAEGYPGLVVHGPLMTLALLEVFRLSQSGASVKVLNHRNLRPLFCGQSAAIEVSSGVEVGHRLTLVTPPGQHVELTIET